jgi:hypothetical protein
LYGVAAAGKPGARRALDILREEIERDLGLLGVRSVAGLSARLLVRSSQLRETGTVSRVDATRPRKAGASSRSKKSKIHS